MAPDLGVVQAPCCAQANVCPFGPLAHVAGRTLKGGALWTL